MNRFKPVLAIATFSILFACGSSGSGGSPGKGGTDGGGTSGGGTSASGGKGGGSGGTSGDGGTQSGGGTNPGGTGGVAGGGGSGGAVGGAAGTSGAGGSGATGGSGGSGGIPLADITDCETSADCTAQPNGTCQIFNVNVSGYNKVTNLGACIYPIIDQTACIGTPLDECCKAADCSGGHCVKYPVNPQCPDPTPPTDHNVCTKGSCACSGFTIPYCIPPGAWGYREYKCIGGSCWEDKMCEQYEPGSRCLPVFDACGVAKSVACVPPVIGCQRPSDCAGGKTCEVVSGIAICK